MQETKDKAVHPKLRELVTEASHSLARLNADRLEELSLSCQALNRRLAQAGRTERLELAEQSREAAEEMAVLGRVLEATRANLAVMNRLREVQMVRLTYGGQQMRQLPVSGSPDGND